MSFCYKKILGVFTHLRVTTPNIIEPYFQGNPNKEVLGALAFDFLAMLNNKISLRK